MNYNQAINYIESFANLDQAHFCGSSGDFMSLKDMQKLIYELDYSSDLDGFIHITGTKGKGSTSAFIASALNELNEPAALFICPHLVDYTERFRLGNKQISKASFTDAVSKVKKRIDNTKLDKNLKVAQFYIIICAFLEWSKTIEANWNVVEVGLGGKNDPTSALSNKKVAVFTAIHKEHSEFLGNTISDITRNKAGIISKGSKVIVAQQEKMEVVDILKTEANNKESEFIYVPELYKTINTRQEDNQQIVSYEGPYGKSSLRLSMLGKHQTINALTALAVVDSLGFESSTRNNSKIAKGFEKTKLPGRFEILNSNPLTILDGAHTVESARLLWSSINEFYNFEKAIVVLAIGKDKEAKPLVFELCNNASQVIATTTSHSKAMPAIELKTIAQKVLDKTVYSRTSVDEALAYAKELSSVNDLILITGSLHTAHNFVRGASIS